MHLQKHSKSLLYRGHCVLDIRNIIIIPKFFGFLRWTDYGPM